MRKFIVGFLLGALLFTSTSVLADNLSLIGKEVQGEAELYLDGKRLSDVIVVDSKSYAPVREIAENLGRSVIYKQESADNKAIVNLSAALFQMEQRINYLNDLIKQKEDRIQFIINNGIELRKSYEQSLNGKPLTQDHIEALEEDQRKRDEIIQEVQKEIDGLKIELEALESAK